jgi:hypothetical protein
MLLLEIENKQEQDNKQIIHRLKIIQIWNTSWGLESSKSGGQIDTRVHQKVAATNLHLNKTQPSLDS